MSPIKEAIEALLHVRDCTYIDDNGRTALMNIYDPEHVDAALAALRSMPAEPVKQGNADEKESGTWPVNPHSQEDGGHDASGACTQGGTGKVQCDQHRVGDADAERENDQRAGRGDGVRGACDVSSPIPYGQVTVVKRPGCQDQHWFYRWPEPPYLDNAAECVTVYATPRTEAVRMSEAEIEGLYPTVKIGDEKPVRLVWFTRNDVMKTARAVEQATAARLGVKWGDARHADQA